MIYLQLGLSIISLGVIFYYLPLLKSLVDKYLLWKINKRYEILETERKILLMRSELNILFIQNKVSEKAYNVISKDIDELEKELNRIKNKLN